MQPRSGRARPPSSPAWGPESWRGRQSVTNTGIPCVCISPSRVQRVEAHRTGMYGPEKPQTATATNNTPTRPSPAPAGLRDGWMDGFRARLHPACRPVPSRILTPAGTPSPPTTPIALSTARPQKGNMHGRLPRPRRPASPLSPPPPPPPPPLRLHHQALAEPDCAASAHLLSDQIDRLPEGLGPETGPGAAEERCGRAIHTPLGHHSPTD
jgi:hypothetical protein